MFQRFENELKKQQLPYQILKGNREERLEAAVKTINQLLKETIS